MMNFAQWMFFFVLFWVILLVVAVATFFGGGHLSSDNNCFTDFDLLPQFCFYSSGSVCSQVSVS